MIELEIVEEVPDQHIRLALVGELDTHGQTQISIKITGLTVPFQRDTIIDMSGVTYISSMGIGLLLRISTGLQRQGKLPVSAGPSAARSQSLAGHSAAKPVECDLERRAVAGGTGRRIRSLLPGLFRFPERFQQAL